MEVILFSRCIRTTPYCANSNTTPALSPVCGGHSAARPVGPEELAVWNQVLALPDTRDELAAKGAPISVKTQVVAGINYTFMFADGSTVRVFHQAWTHTLKVMRITPATTKNPARALVKLMGAHSASPLCPKCGINAKSGKLSCCAPGGAWFKKCGGVGDASFDHTWTEGIQACKSTLLRDIDRDEEQYFDFL